MEVISNPPVPYWGRIPGGLQVGKMILVAGHVNNGAHRFNIDFSRGIQRDTADIALHFNPRFDQRIVVRNSYSERHWKNEERESPLFPFTAGRDFEIIFLIQDTHFKIAVNGRHFVQFVHRLPINTVDKINIEGNVRIQRIEFTWENPINVPSYPARPQPSVYPPGPTYPSRPDVCPPGPTYQPQPGVCPPGPTYQPQPAVCPPGPTYQPKPAVCPPGPFVPPPAARSTLQPVHNPALPFKYPLYDGLRAGMMIYISGRPNNSPNRFEINLMCGAAPEPPPDIAFHFNPRFEQRVVVRNSYIHRDWGNEEKNAYGFPFEPGVYFDLIIRIENEKYMIAINGKHFVEYRHRVMPLSRVNTLEICGDVMISHVRFQ